MSQAASPPSPLTHSQEDLRFLGQSARVLFTESSTQPANIQEELRLIYEAIRKLEGKLEGSIHELKTSVQELKTSIDEVRVETRQKYVSRLSSCRIDRNHTDDHRNSFIQTKNFNSQTLDLLPARSGQPPNSPGGGSFPKTYADIQAKTCMMAASFRGCIVLFLTRI